jgi:hypothetical protein
MAIGIASILIAIMYFTQGQMEKSVILIISGTIWIIGSIYRRIRYKEGKR